MAGITPFRTVLLSTLSRVVGNATRRRRRKLAAIAKAEREQEQSEG